MEKLLDLDTLQGYLDLAIAWVFADVLVIDNLFQLVVLVLVFLAARLVAPRIDRLGELVAKAGWYQRIRPTVHPVLKALQALLLPAVWLVAQWLLVLIAKRTGLPHHLMEAAVSLLTAWVIIRLATLLVPDPAWAKLIALLAWSVAALNILGLLGWTLEFLDSLALGMGNLRISVLSVVSGIIAFTVLLWLARLVTDLLERRLKAATTLTPSARVLIGKMTRIVLIAAALLVALDSVGIDFAALAVFSGAVGLGIGFGLQKVVSNLISGVILLMDKSVKPGDVIVVGEAYGWINSLKARYVSVITRDGKEHLIPNEELISQKVENWSFSNSLVRLKLPFGISYDSQPREAIELAVAAARAVPRILAEPAPRCLLMGFGDSSVDLELRVWIRDPQNGVSNVKSEVYLILWDKLHEAGITIPFPQRDIHIKSAVAAPAPSPSPSPSETRS